MKFSYSLIKKNLSGAPAKTKLIEGLNLRSFETENIPGDIFEVSLPPNRYSDAASHIGIAREVGAIFGLKGKNGFRNPVKALVNPPSNKGFIKIDVREPKLCKRYAARYFELRGGVKDSPRWVKDVLISCGVKPINNLVDIMNYVMLETGQPLHVFDADNLATSDKRRGTRQVIVRRAKKGEKIKTLDGQKFSLDKDVLVIADKGGPLAIAGVKGGADSGVTEKTRRIIVEAANFDPVFTYRAARKLKLQTDASLRFGHGLSPALVRWGLDRATEFLLKEKAWLLDSVDYYPKPTSSGVIEFSVESYESLIGVTIDIKKAQKYFELLGFEILSQKRDAKQKPNENKLFVKIPAWRTDIQNKEDLVEEVVRIEGYGKFKSKAPVLSMGRAHQDDAVSIKDKVRNILVGLRLDEVYNSSFVGEADIKSHKLLAMSNRLAELENPIAKDKKYLRPSLLPLLMKNAEENSRHYGGVRIFEVGKAFTETKNVVEESLSLGILLSGKGDDKIVLEMKGLTEEVLAGLGVSDFSTVHAGDSLRIEANHKVLAVLGHTKLDKDLNVAFGELDLDKILPMTEEAKEYVSIKRFPAVLRDVSVLVASEVRIGSVLQEIQFANKKIIENVDLVDEYVNEKLRGRQSLTFRIIFQADNRTLTDAEVNAEMDKITVVLRNKFKAEIR